MCASFRFYFYTEIEETKSELLSLSNSNFDLSRLIGLVGDSGVELILNYVVVIKTPPIFLRQNHG